MNSSLRPPAPLPFPPWERIHATSNPQLRRNQSLASHPRSKSRNPLCFLSLPNLYQKASKRLHCFLSLTNLLSCNYEFFLSLTKNAGGVIHVLSEAEWNAGGGVRRLHPDGLDREGAPRLREANKKRSVVPGFSLAGVQSRGLRPAHQRRQSQLTWPEAASTIFR